MAAKHKTIKKTVKKKAPSRQVKVVESVIPEQAQTPVIPNIPFQPAQQTQPLQPTQPIQTQPIQTAQPMQSIQAASLSDASASQPPPIQEASSFENSMTQPASVFMGAPTVAATDAEPEIKIGIENKLASDVEAKSTDPKPNSSEGAGDNQNKPGQKKNLLLPIIFIVLLGAAVLSGLFIYRQNFSNKVEEKINEVSLSPTPVEKVTPKPLDLSKFEIEILNGSGIAGEASSQKSNLEGVGFKVSSIGNADNSDYAETVIQAKKGVEKVFLDKLKTTLEKSFEVTSEVLGEDAETDIIIIVGSSKAK